MTELTFIQRTNALGHPSILAIAIATILSTSLLGGCASLPDDGELSNLPDASQFSASNLNNQPEITWPDDQWWQHYQDAQLNQMIDEALRNAPDMKIAAARLQSAAAVVGISSSALAPNVSANLSAERQKQSYNYLTPEYMTPDGWQNYGRATLDFNWEMDFWGKNRASLAAATSSLKASQAEMAEARLTLSTSIASAYAELAHLYASRDTLQRALDIRSTTARLMQERYDNGLETRGSLRRAESLRASASSDLQAIDEQLGLQRNQLAALLGAGPDRGHQISRPTLQLNQASGLPAELSLNLLGRRPDIVAARLQAESLRHQSDAREAAFYPNVNLSAFIGVQSLGLDQLSDGGSRIGSVGPAISLPIFNSGRLKSELRQTRAGYEEAVANYQRTVSRALQDVANVAVSQQALALRMHSTSEAVTAAQEAWQISRNRYQGGLDSYLEVLTAEDLLLNNQRALTDLQARALTLDVALMQALGGGYQQPVSE
jgi:NodT family efflux transporter outer membrane factor (OMF) lipoprotein